MESTTIKQINGHKIACAHLDAGGETIVIFCHGYRSSSIGPNRLFVGAARKLANHDISSLRFDQYGSGNSEGEFRDSSFDDWMATTKVIVEHYLGRGFRVVLFGQSMGGATVLGVGAKISRLAAIVAWVPAPNVHKFTSPANGLIEEGGQIVQARYWQEAHDAHIADKLANVQAPVYIVQCSDDEYVSAENHQTIEANAQPHHRVELLEGYKHSAWTYNQASKVIDKSINFILENLSR